MRSFCENSNFSVIDVGHFVVDVGLFVLGVGLFVIHVSLFVIHVDLFMIDARAMQLISICQFWCFFSATNFEGRPYFRIYFDFRDNLVVVLAEQYLMAEGTDLR